MMTQLRIQKVNTWIYIRQTMSQISEMTIVGSFKKKTNHIRENSDKMSLSYMPYELIHDF